MVFAGKNIIDPTDNLQKVTLDYLYHSIKSPKPNVDTQLRQLQAIKQLDNRKYEQMKRRLPFIVTACFRPPLLRDANFAYIEHFILDLDELTSKQIDIETCRSMLKDDPRVLMLFKSQGGDGLKIMFRLSERCYDSGIYSVFVKEFAKMFFLKYDIKQYVDNKKSDITYACFISKDEEIWYNPEAEPVNISEFLDQDNPLAFFDIKKQQEIEEKLYIKQKKEMNTDEDHTIGDEELSHVKSILQGERYAKRMAKLPAVSKELEEMMAKLVPFIESQGIQVYEIINLNHAKKIRCRRGAELAELNIFKSGDSYKIINAPRCCTSEYLNTLVRDIISVFLKQKD